MTDVQVIRTYRRPYVPVRRKRKIEWVLISEVQVDVDWTELHLLAQKISQRNTNTK